MLAATPSFAATVTSLQGQVLVNTGNGYRPLTGSAELPIGASVVANPGALAQVSFPDGCGVQISPGSVFTVGQISPCAANANTGTGGINPLAVGVAVLGGAGAVIMLSQSQKSASP